jgi:hypothetical protein
MMLMLQLLTHTSVVSLETSEEVERRQKSALFFLLCGQGAAFIQWISHSSSSFLDFVACVCIVA